MKSRNSVYHNHIFVISGPSGVGKGTVVNKILSLREDTRLSVSVTTRSPRPHEQEGRNYYYKSKVEFETLINDGKLLEWAEFAGHYYGTLKEEVETLLSKGFNVILEIEVQGALQVQSLLPEAIMIFISPPSFATLKERLVGRHTDSEEAIEKRLSIMEKELHYINQFDYNVINDDLEETVEALNTILIASQFKVCQGVYPDVSQCHSS